MKGILSSWTRLEASDRSHCEALHVVSAELQQQRELLMQALQGGQVPRLLYNRAHDDGSYLSQKLRAFYASCDLPLLALKLRCVYSKLHANERSVVATVELDRMGLYTSLRIVRAPSVEASRRHAGDSFELEGASMESTAVLTTMEAGCERSLLVEGRAGIGKSTWTIHLAQLQNFEPGVVILLRLSGASKYLEGKHAAAGGAVGLGPFPSASSFTSLWDRALSTLTSWT